MQQCTNNERNKKMKITLRKPKNWTSVLSHIEKDARQNGINFKHNGSNGNGTGYGFSGHYAIHPEYIIVTLTKKPFIVSEARIKREVEEYWTQICAEVS